MYRRISILLVIAQLTACSGGSVGSTDGGVSSDASLSAISVSDVVLDQIFQPSVLSYSGTTFFLSSSITVAATTSDPNATVSINGIIAPSAIPTGPINLVEGTNTITVVVTAEDKTTTETYTVTVNRQSLNSLAQEAYIKASNPVDDNEFGVSVAVSGDTVAIGAPFESNSSRGINGDQNAGVAIDSGAVYVFARDGAGMWSQQAYIKASNADPVDYFGSAVALDGDTLVVGAPGEQSGASGVGADQNDNSIPSGSGSGAVYVFTRDNNDEWTQQEYIKASNTDAFDAFGSRVAISGDSFVVGVSGEDGDATSNGADQDNNGLGDSGAAYVFVRNGANNWTQQAYLKASNADFGDFFGFSIAMHQDVIAVGSVFEFGGSTGVNGDQSNNDIRDSGAAYVFRRSEGGSWSQEAYLKASNTDEFDRFGSSVAVYGDTVVVGAVGEASSSTGVDGDQLDNNSSRSGAAYVFHRDRFGVWSQQSYLKSSNAFEEDLFGVAASIFGDTLVIGAVGESSAASGINGNELDDTEPDAGAAYIFVRHGEAWEQKAYVKPSNTDDNFEFGLGVSVANGSLVIGARGEYNIGEIADGGAAYIFR